MPFYTDKLSQLPRERRAYYLRQQKAQEEERRKLEARIGKAEMQRRELEKKRKALEASQTQAAELAKRRQELTAQINAMDKARSAKLADKATWKKRMKEARAERDALLLAFQKKQKEYNELAIKPAFTLLPGEAKKKEAARKELQRLESELDAAIMDVQVNLPNQARKARVPPGWLR